MKGLNESKKNIPDENKNNEQFGGLVKSKLENGVPIEFKEKKMRIKKINGKKNKKFKVSFVLQKVFFQKYIMIIEKKKKNKPTLKNFLDIAEALL